MNWPPNSDKTVNKPWSNHVEIIISIFRLVGVLNLTHRNGHSVNEISSLKPGERYIVQLDLDVAGYTVHAGHQLRLALSQSYWPYCIWPPPYIPILQLHFTSPPVFTLPLRQRSEDIKIKDQSFGDLGQPVVKQHALAVREIRKPSFERSASRVKYLRINLHFVFHGLHQTGEKFRTHADAGGAVVRGLAFHL